MLLGTMSPKEVSGQRTLNLEGGPTEAEKQDFRSGDTIRKLNK